MFNSIQTRTMFFMVSLAACLIIILSYILVTGIERIAYDREREILVKQTAILAMQAEVEGVDALPRRLGDFKISVFSSAGLAKNAGYDISFSGKSSFQEVYKHGQSYMSCLYRLKQPAPGFLLVEESFSTAFADINNLKTITIIVAVLVLAFLWIYAKKLSLRIVAPIRDLASSVSAVAAGDIGLEVLTPEKNELSDIAAAFNLMQNNLKSTMQQVLTQSGETASMHELMEYTEHAAEDLPSGIISINKVGEITTFNEAAERLIGLSSKDILGLNIQNPVPIEIRPLIDTLKRCLTKGSLQLKTIDDIYDAAGHKISVLYSTNIQFGLRGEVLGAVCVFRSINDIRRFEENTNRIRNLRSLGEMSAGIAHEIKNPLTAIRGFAQLTKLELEEKQLSVDNIDIIMSEADRLTQVVDHFLSFAHPKVPILKKVDLNALLTYCITLISHRLPDNIQIQRYFQNVPLVMADEETLESVILNLLLNAIQAMPQGGKITMKSGHSHKRKMISVEVIDNGVGIPRELSDRIFEPFFTTKANGVGMGLAVSSRIIEAHKGVLEVESVEGEGTKFTLLLQAVS